MTLDDDFLRAQDRDFLEWVRAAPSADLTAKWHELVDVGWLPDLWKLRAIERELERRGEREPWT
jgi:hypothetical protein